MGHKAAGGELPDPVLDLWVDRNRGDEPPTTQDLSALLQRLVQKWPVVVVDALDELPHKDSLRLIHPCRGLA